jgi:hypothetical protein
LSHSGSNPRLQTSTTQVFRSWSHGMTNVSIPVVNMLKNSWTLAVSVATNISMKLCFVSVNGPREPYLLDEPRISYRTVAELQLILAYPSTWGELQMVCSLQGLTNKDLIIQEIKNRLNMGKCLVPTSSNSLLSFNLQRENVKIKTHKTIFYMGKKLRRSHYIH